MTLLRQVEVASRTSPVPSATAAEMRVMRADAARVRAQQDLVELKHDAVDATQSVAA